MTGPTADTTGQPLFIVDRDWLRQGPKARKSWTGSVRNRSLYGLAIEVSATDKVDKSTRSRSKSKAMRKWRGKREDSASDRNSEPELSGRVESQSQSPETAMSSLRYVCSTVQNEAETKPSYFSFKDTNSTSRSVLQRELVNLNSFDDYESYLDYYLDIVNGLDRPTESHYPIHSDGMTPSWFPLTFDDDHWLRTITMFPSRSRNFGSDETTSSHTNALMSSLISQLNDGISRSELSDETISSASCLALGEHIKGNDHLARIHASGLTEMIRLRGGLETIDRLRRARIARADIILSVDHLTIPMLERPPNINLSLTSMHPAASEAFAQALIRLGQLELNASLLAILGVLKTLCQQLDLSMTSKVIISAVSYYEKIVGLNHDLLSMGTLSGVDEIFRLSLLGFLQPMFRYTAFESRCGEVRSAKLKLALESSDMSFGGQEIEIWLTFNAYMLSQKTSRGPWFKRRLLTLLDRFEISRRGAWPALRAQLETFLWTESIHNCVGNYFYTKLEQDECPIPNKLIATFHIYDGRRHSFAS